MNDHLRLIEFFSRRFGESKCFLCIADISRDGSFNEQFFKYPDGATAMVAHVLARRDDRDMYFCPHPLSGPRRNKKTVTSKLSVVWADLDSAEPDLIEPKPSLVVCTSPGRFQALWTLNTAVSKSEAEAASRGIAEKYKHLGVDPSGWDLSQLLRIPWTRNFKYSDAPWVNVVRDDDIEYSINEFAIIPAYRLAVNDAVPEKIPSTAEVLGRHDVAHILARHPVNDRSRTAFGIELSLFEHGLDETEVFALVREHPSNKYRQDDRPDQELWREVCKAKRRVAEKKLRTPQEHEDEPSIFFAWPQFWSRDRRAVDWLYQDVLARGRGHAIYAKHKAGKSLLMLWVALQCVEAGIVVIYLDFEMSEDDVQERLEEMGCSADTDMNRLRYALLPSLPPLDTPEGGKRLHKIVDDVQSEFPGRELLLVIDTTSRAVEGQENSADTINAFHRMTGLGLKQRGITWVRLDHSGKDQSRGQRGSSAKGDDVDIVWRMSRTEGGVRLDRDAARISWARQRLTFHQREQPLRFERADSDWLAGSAEVAALLDSLDVPPESSMKDAANELLKAGKSRRFAVVQDAQRLRRVRKQGSK
ncbi:MAG: AAA family ATPase [Actinomycetota bacterium]